jgi:hypothetical protein
LLFLLRKCILGPITLSKQTFREQSKRQSYSSRRELYFHIFSYDHLRYRFWLFALQNFGLNLALCVFFFDKNFRVPQSPHTWGWGPICYVIIKVQVLRFIFIPRFIPLNPVIFGVKRFKKKKVAGLLRSTVHELLFPPLEVFGFKF